MELIKSNTYQNLAKAFAGETMARTRYEFIEYGARKEGYKTLAEMIDTVAYQEFNHARMLYTFIQKASDDTIKNIEVCSGYPFKQKWNLTDNLLFAAEDEESEADEIYPTFAKVAEDEGFKDIALLFRNLASVESSHRALFIQLHDQLKNGTLYEKEQAVTWRCADCGYEATATSPWEECPLCKAKKGAVLLQI
ncbi:MAG: rubrerythrin family protein [Clostridia bacterium]|nr:rubrerythrin family protein [Clostridia bacterium]